MAIRVLTKAQAMSIESYKRVIDLLGKSQPGGKFVSAEPLASWGLEWLGRILEGLQGLLAQIAPGRMCFASVSSPKRFEHAKGRLISGNSQVRWRVSEDDHVCVLKGNQINIYH